MATSCHFCDKVSRLPDLPAEDIVWQFPHAIALLGPWQYYAGYCILVSRVHATELHQLPSKVCREFLDEMVLLAGAIQSTFQPQKMNYELLGNQVPHLHWHLFPRRADDPEALKPVWLALDRAERDGAERARLQAGPVSRSDISSRLRATLGQLHAPTL